MLTVMKGMVIKMRIKKEDMQLYVVTDRSWLGENKLAAQVEEILKAGATLLQLREKDMTYEAFVEEAKEIKQLTDQYQIPFIINDRVDVARAVAAAGIHIGQDDGDIIATRELVGENMIIGVSVHTVEEAIEAQSKGADYIGVGAVFSTSTKKDANHVSHEILRKICAAVTIPVVAIGGITKDNILELTGTGVDGAAVISAIFACKDVGKATEELAKLAKRMVRREAII